MMQAFKNAVFSAKSKDELRDNILKFWESFNVDDVIDLNWLGNRPKYKKAVSTILLNEYQAGKIFAIWSQDETKIRKTW
jgi:hypothetical protein